MSSRDYRAARWPQSSAARGRGFWFGAMAVVVVASCWLYSGAAYAEVYAVDDGSGVLVYTNVSRRQAGRKGSERRLTGPKEASRKRLDENDFSALLAAYRTGSTAYDDHIVAAAQYYTLPKALVKAVVAVESAFEPAAVSSAGAQGLMQLLPSTARLMYVGDAFDPRDNIFGGCRYLRILANRFQGDLRLTLAGYNAGPEAVERSGGVPDYSETRTYVRRVLALYRHYQEHWRAD